MFTHKCSPVHPGEILQEEFLEPLGISQYRISHDISVPPRRINEIVKGLRSITADTALRLARYFGNSAQFWLNLQSHYDIETEEQRPSRNLKREVKIYSRRKHFDTATINRMSDKSWAKLNNSLAVISKTGKNVSLSDFIVRDRQKH